MSKRPEGLNFDEEDEGMKKSTKQPLPPANPIKLQSDIPAYIPEIKKEIPKPVEVKKEPPKTVEIKKDEGLLQENPTGNLGGNKKKQLFSDSDSDEDSDEDDATKRELKERLARMHSKKLNI